MRSLYRNILSLMLFSLFNLSAIVFSPDIRGEEVKDYHIAILGPMNQTKDAGNSFFRAAQLFLEQNQIKHEEKGFRIILTPFNDENKSELAQKYANEVALSDQFLGVIGHNYSSISMEAGKIYKKFKIPVITPTSTNENVTKDNDWYFRTIFDDQEQGEFLSYYSKLILGKNNVILIHEQESYGKSLADVYERSAKKVGLKIRNKISYPSDNISKAKLSELIKQVTSGSPNDLILLAGHYRDGVQIIKVLRQNNLDHLILTPDSFAHSGFAEEFSDLPREAEKPGYYSNGIHVAVPLLYSSANSEAQFFQQAYRDLYEMVPDWRAAFAYDSILLFSKAIERTLLKNPDISIQESRLLIKDYLKSLDSSVHSIKGVTGLNFFDAQGNSPKAITIGQYKNKELIPAVTQVTPISDIKEVSNLKEAIKDGDILLFGDRYMYKTNIIFTGVEINNIQQADLDSLSYSMNFDIWFRYGGSVDVRNIEFLNSKKPIQLRMPIEEIQQGKSLYRRYNIKGEFFANYIAPAGPNKHTFGVNFAHKSMPRENLIFIVDSIGGLSPNNTDQISRHILPPSWNNWNIEKIISRQGLYLRKILGNVKYINRPSKKITYSQFSTTLHVGKSGFNLQEILKSNIFSYFLLGIGVILGLLFQRKIQLINQIYALRLIFNKQSNQCPFPDRRKAGFSYMDVGEAIYDPPKPGKTYKRRKTDPIVSDIQCWFFSSLALLISFFAIESITIDVGFKYLDTESFNTLDTAFKTLWWFIPAYILVSLIKNFLWEGLERRSGRKVPPLMRGFSTFIIYSFTAFAVIAFVFDQKITSILGTSGIFVMIIGLAVQMNISNVVAGLVLNMEKSISIGDWVAIGDMKEGKVIEMTWRTTKIKTTNDVILNIPNNTISELEFTNYTSPLNLACKWFYVDIDQNTPYEKAQKCFMDALKSVELVKDPIVKFNTYTHWLAKYLIMYSMEDYGTRYRVKGLIWEAIIKHMKARGIKVASLKIDDQLLQD